MQHRNLWHTLTKTSLYILGAGSHIQSIAQILGCKFSLQTTSSYKQDLHMKTKIEIRRRTLLGGQHHSPLTQRRVRRPWRRRPLHSTRPPRIHHICLNSDSCHSSLGSRLPNTYQGGGYTATQPTFERHAVPLIHEAKSDDKTRYICSSQDTHLNSKPRTTQLWQ